MENIIAPIDRTLIKKELKDERFLRKTNFGDNTLYIITAHNSPNTMQEIGRLREIAFRDGGGGTGKSVDIDEFDTMETPYKQLIVWDPENEEILGGYRFIDGCDVKFSQDRQPLLSSTEIFNFTPKFINEYLPKTIELGRSFVQPAYQTLKKGLYSLDNLWDGLGALITLNPHISYFFGKVTMYQTYNKEARDFLLFFVQKYFPDNGRLVIPTNQLPLETPLEKLTAAYEGKSLDEAYKTMSKLVRERGETIPPLFNSYIKLSATMRTFGTVVNHHFGDVEETGILITINDIYDSKKERHLLHK
ncbi:MAG: GNAT family N-acetyltransferase [Bacteroidales bacterium]|jgi:hypothetical protein|nr:GNAT family N-acetyltransferase [Bacteroidales bacterium]